MKITDIKSFPVWVGGRNQLIVKLETDEGLYGLGESGLSGRELAVTGAVKHYRQFLIGRDPMMRGALWQEVYRSQYFEGGRVLTAALSAIDIALHDIAGKALSVPVHQLLGGKHRDRVPCFITSMNRMTDSLIEDVQALIAEGWPAIRLLAGEPTHGEDETLYEPREAIAVTAEWLTRLREAIGCGPVLGLECHHHFSVAEAASLCQRLPSGALDFIEEAIRDETPEAYEALRRLTNVPFAIGEEFSSKWAFLPYIERGIADFVRLDICNVGGFTEAMKIAGLAEAHYVDLMPHNPLGPVCTAANVHLAAAVPNFSWLEVWRAPPRDSDYIGYDLVPGQPLLEGTGFAVPDTPGLGVTFDEDLATRNEFEFQFWEPPHRRRRDGAFHSW